MTRRHYLRDRTDYGLHIALCGEMHGEAARFTSARSETTCRRCQRLFDEVGFAPPTPPPKDYPPRPVTPQTWDPRGLRIVEESRAGERRGTRWGSVDNALHEYVSARTDGYASKSASGSHEQIARMGVRVQEGGRSLPRSLQQAEGAAEVERSLVYATRRRLGPLSATQERDVFLARRVGSATSEKMYRRHAVRVFQPVASEVLAGQYGVGLEEVHDVERRVFVELVVDMVARRLVPEPGGGWAWWPRVMERRAQLERATG